MAKIIFGNHSAVVVPLLEREKIRKFYCDILGCKLVRVQDLKDDFQIEDRQLGVYFYIAFLYGDFPYESEFLRSGKAIYLELKSDNVEETKQKILDFGVEVIEVGDPHLYFQAPGGQVFRLVGIDEDLTKYERDVDNEEENVQLRKVTAGRVDVAQGKGI